MASPPERLVSPKVISGGIEAIEKSVREERLPTDSHLDKFNKLKGFKDLLKIAKGIPFVILPGASFFATTLEVILEKSEKQLSLEESIASICMMAYLNSYKEFIKGDYSLWNSINSRPVSESYKQQIEDLNEFDLDKVWDATNCFHETNLAQYFGRVLSVRLGDAGLEEHVADIWTRRVARNIYRYLFQSCMESREDVRTQTLPAFSKWDPAQKLYKSIEDYLGDNIVKNQKDTVFGEQFTFWDIYVPLKAKPVDRNGKVNKYAKAFDLEHWARNILDDSGSDGVMFVQGGPGRGKSIFCRMFADWVRTHRYPLWIPVLIRLRDITLQSEFAKTLPEAVPAGLARDPEWLVNRHAKYLFLLDGFDELVLKDQTRGGLKDFLLEVAKFQETCLRDKDMGHRVLITGRPLALQGMELQMPDNLERVSIEVMDDDLQGEWFEKWEKLVGTEKANAFQEFLRDDRCPKGVQELAREPLLLYLLGAMHRDEELQRSDFEGARGTDAKIGIYDKSLDWVLKKQRPASLQRQLTGQEINILRRILAEVGLCVVQSGGEIASVKAIEFRLQQGENAERFPEEARKLDNLRNALTVFYLQKGRSEGSVENDISQGSVEFVHKSFGEFLCAECIKEGLEAWTASAQLPWPIYDLLGYGALTPEIVEYLMGLLTASNDFSPVQLFDRLSDFYFRWSEGEFIDADVPENLLPWRKMKQLREQEIQQGQRQVDVYAGLNVMILLLELHRYARYKDELKDSIAFYPCGKPNSKGTLEDDELLLRIIGYSHCIGASGFRDTVGRFLRGADLIGANLSFADLSFADLSGADLSGADLSGAKLGGADLSCADLRGADLRGANLSFADLSAADLSGADLSAADLSEADLRGAVLSDEKWGDIRWDRDTKWENVRGLETADLPEALRQHLGL